MTTGIKLAAIYSFYPYKFGFCGPQKESEKEVIYRYISGEKISEEKVRKILENFKAAPFYYKLIAQSNGVNDYLNERVVKNYWLGSDDLEKVPIDSLKKMVAEDFGKGERIKEIPDNSKAHHSFHVLFIGPLTEGVVFKDRLLDLCRIGWGKVIDYKIMKGEERVVLEHQPLGVKRGRYFLRKIINRLVSRDKKIVPQIRIGDNVAIHWGHVVQVLNKKDLANLKKYTQITIDSLNNMRK